MKNYRLASAIMAVVISMNSALAFAQQLYWDTNGANTGATDTAPDAPGTWDGVTSNWNTDANGDAATQAWTADSIAVFSAGGDASGTFNVTLSGTQSASGVVFEDGVVTLTGGQLTLTGAATVDVPSLSGEGRIDSMIGGAAGLNTTGPGVLILAGANTYSGATTVGVSNTLRLGAANVLPDTTVLTLPTTANSGTTFQLNGFDDTVGSLSGGIATGAPIIALGSNTLTLADPQGETFSGLFTASAGGRVVKNGVGSITLTGQSGGFAGGEFVLNSGNVAIGNVNIFGTNANGSKLTINGGSFTNSAPATSRSMSVANIDIAGSFAYNGTGSANVEWLGTAVSGEGTAVVTLKVANPTITVNQTSTGTFIFRGPIGDEGQGRGLTKDGNGDLTLANPSNSYSGATTILSGRIRIDANGVLGNGAGTLFLSGGALTVSASGRSPTTSPVANPVVLTTDSAITTVSSAATVDLNLTGTLGGSAGTLTFRNDGANDATDLFDPHLSGSGFNFTRPIVIDNGTTGKTRLSSFNGPATSQTFSGVISGTGSYNRSVSSGLGGDTVFTGDNTYSGGTTINAGRLLVNNTSGSGTGTGPVAVNSGGILAGTGALSGAVTVNTNGTLAPGTSIESLDVGELNVAGGAIAIEINSGLAAAVGADLLNANGNLNIAVGSTLSVSDLGAATLAPGTKYTLISYAGAWDNGLFNGIADDSTITVGANSFTINYNDTTGGTNFGGGAFMNRVTLTIPGAAGVPGDYNSNGVVDAADYVLWRNGGPLTNEVDTPGTVNAADYTAWRARFGNTSGSGAGFGAAAVPEPAAFTLFAVAVACLWAGSGVRYRETGR